jgi:hypothetical protein
MGQDIRDQFRRDREEVLDGLEALGASPPERRRALERLAMLRRCWKVHVLALEAVIYRALESRDAGAESSRQAEERLVEHKRIDAMFDRMQNAKPGSITWRARLVVLREMMLRHLESEGDLALRLEAVLPVDALDELSASYELVRDKLAVLELAKAA